MCTIEADTSRVQPKRKVSRYGTAYYEISFQIAILFGLTELKAQIIYKENVSAMFELTMATVLYLTPARVGRRETVRHRSYSLQGYILTLHGNIY